MNYPKNLLYVLLVAVFAVWGGGIVAMKFAFQSFTIIHIVFARVAIAAIFYIILNKYWRHLPYQKGDWKYLCALVMFEPCLFFIFETSSLAYTTASQAGVIVACFPLCTAIGAWFFLHEKLTKYTILGIILAVIGVAGASWFADNSGHAVNALLGNFLMVGAVLSSTGYALCARHITQRYSFLAISAIQAIGGTIVFLPFFLASPLPATYTTTALCGLLYLGIGVGICAYLGFNFGINQLPAAVVALFANLIPIFTLIFAYVFLHENITGLQIVFALVTLAGVLISSIPSKK